MKRLLFALVMLVFVSCGSSEQKFDTESYEKNKESLEEKERKQPKQFLSVTSTDKKEFLIGRKVIRITVKNNASVCTYKDVKVRIGFYSETGTRLTEEEETIFKTVPPNNSITYKTKIFAPKGTDDVKVVVVDAKVED